MNSPTNGGIQQLRERISRLPQQPGVYLFRDAQGAVLYVGKAVSLRDRVGSYLQPPHRLAPRIAQLVGRISDVDVRPVNSEAEALLLETQLIKSYRPKYNVAFRDDKSFPLLKLTHEPFPRLLLTRTRKADGARYFGPYADPGLLRQALQFFRRVFPLRTCRTFPKTPCLEYHLGQCLAPCVGYVDEAAYRRIVENLAAFLEGRRDDVLKDLTRRMREASRRHHFEEAARLRDQIQALSSAIVAKEKSALAGPLEQLQLVLKLAAIPHRIEAFDISDIHGQDAVGSMVMFVDARPRKADYRMFKIETVHGIDDVKMMREVIRRRYGGSLAASLPMPDLILVDGGKGQLGAALEALREVSKEIPAIGLAKRFEHIIVPQQSEPIVLLPTSPVLHLVQHIRNEAHRFAITYHRRLRRRRARISALDENPGIGPARRALLLRRFGSITKLRSASVEDVVVAARISPAHAQIVLDCLNSPITKHQSPNKPQ